MALLNKSEKEELDRIITSQRVYNWIRAAYVFGMIGFCWYTKHNDTYDIWYHQIVSFVLTANVIWLYFDIFQNTLNRVFKVIRTDKWKGKNDN